MKTNTKIKLGMAIIFTSGLIMAFGLVSVPKLAGMFMLLGSGMLIIYGKSIILKEGK